MTATTLTRPMINTKTIMTMKMPTTTMKMPTPTMMPKTAMTNF